MAKQAAHARQYVRSIQQRINEVKTEQGCAMCGFKLHPAALHFHHRITTEKTAGIGTLWNRHAGWKLIKEEMEKCIVLCANHHAIIHGALPDD